MSEPVLLFEVLRAGSGLIEKAVDPLAGAVGLGWRGSGGESCIVVGKARSASDSWTWNLRKTLVTLFELPPMADAPMSKLEVDLLIKLLRRPGMSREVRLALLVIGGIRLDVEAWDGSWRRSEKEAEEMPPPM